LRFFAPPPKIGRKNGRILFFSGGFLASRIYVRRDQILFFGGGG